MIDPRVVQTVTRVMPMEPRPLLTAVEPAGLGATTDRRPVALGSRAFISRLENLLIIETPATGVGAGRAPHKLEPIDRLVKSSHRLACLISDFKGF
jgi:hypothetical protein